MSKALQLQGQHFDRLTVIKRISDPHKSQRSYWKCLCVCGKTTTVKGKLLKSGETRSCGCLRKIAHNFIDLTNKKYGRLTVLRQEGRRGERIIWHCSCSCGNHVLTDTGSLASGNTRSCGCLRKDLRTKHGHTRTIIGQKRRASPEYDIWQAMIQRCRNKNNKAWKDYGGRGIKVCKRWAKSFVAFLDDVGFRPKPHLSIDRINNDGNYEPGNIRWATRKEQSANKGRKLT